ncbi:MAG: serine hydrolase domain-containing protein [Maritimibacter sp.]
MRRFFARGLAAVGLVSPATADPGFDAVFASLSGAPAMSAGYIQNGSAPHVAVRGVAFKTGPKVAQDARWHIGSITKSFTAALIMRMELDLDAPLSTIVPDVAAQMHPEWQCLTLRELLSHTSGVAPNTVMKGAWDISASGRSGQRAAVLARHWGKPLPGMRGSFTYSNLGYVLAGHIAETITGLPYETLLMKEVITPLGLMSVGFGAPHGAGDAQGHRGRLAPRPISPSDPQADNPAWMAPAGTLHMTLADLLIWGQANMEASLGERPAFLSKAQCAQMHATMPGGYGFGWQAAQIKRGDGTTALVQGHNGSNTMWVANLFYDPKRRLVVANAMNRARLMLSQKHLIALWQSLD